VNSFKILNLHRLFKLIYNIKNEIVAVNAMNGFIIILGLLLPYVAVIWYLGYKEYKNIVTLLSYLENNYHDKWYYLSNEGTFMPLFQHSIFSRFHKFLKSDEYYNDIQIKSMKEITMNFHKRRLLFVYLLPLYGIFIAIVCIILKLN
jgi:hypothetical protein